MASGNHASAVRNWAARFAAFQSQGDVLSIWPCYNGNNSRRPGKDKATRPPRAVIVLDSSFNPPTLAHLRMAASAFRSIAPRYDGHLRVLLLLAVNNADKAPKPAPFPTRLAMMDSFAEDLTEHLSSPGDPGSSATVDVDVGVTTRPYFHEKSRAIAAAAAYHQESETTPPHQTEQIFLAGYDTLIRIFDPKYYSSPDGMQATLEPFFAQARLRITMRTDDQWGTKDDQVSYLERLTEGGLEEFGGKREWAERVELVDGSKDVVSSTRVREAAGRGDDGALVGLLSPRVREFVLGEGLYVNNER